MILLKTSSVVLLNHLWEANADRSMFSLMIGIKDFAYMRVKLQLANAEDANISVLKLQQVWCICFIPWLDL